MFFCKSLFRRRLIPAITVAAILVILSSSPVSALSSPDTALTFSLASDTAMPPQLAGDGDTLIVMPFEILRTPTAPCSLHIDGVYARVEYDADKLDFVGVEVDTTVWPYTFTASNVVDGDSSYVNMEFTGSAGDYVEACSLPETFATLTFKPVCGAETGSSEVTFVQDANLCVVDYNIGGLHHPTTFTDAWAYLPPLAATYSIHDAAFTGPAGDTVEVPIYIENNFRVQLYYMFVEFDSSMLGFVGCEAEYEPGNYFNYSNQGDTAILVYISSFTGDYMPVRSTEFEVFTLKFVTKCDLWADSTQLVLPDTAIIRSPCLHAFTPTLESGTITLAPEVSYSAVYSGDPVGVGDTMEWDIQISSTIAVGNVSGATGDTTGGIVANVNLPSNMESNGSSSINNDLAFQHRHVNDRYVSMYQKVDAVKPNFVGPGDTLDLTCLEVELTANPTTLPTWSNPYIEDVPVFVDTNIAACVGKSRVPDTVCSGASADSSNGLLTWSAFPKAKAAVCQFFNEGDMVYVVSTDTIDIWAKSNVAIDEVGVTLVFSAENDIFTGAYPETGVSATISQDGYSLTVSTNGSFAGCSANDSVLLVKAKINKAPSQSQHIGSSWMSFSSMSAERSGDPIFTDYDAREIRYNQTGGLDKSADNNGLPSTFALYQNYPNPFNPTTTLSLALPEASDWQIEIYNVLGQRVETFEGYSGAGTVQVEWDASPHASGVYLYRATAGDFRETRKMLLTK